MQGCSEVMQRGDAASDAASEASCKKVTKYMHINLI